MLASCYHHHHHHNHNGDGDGDDGGLKNMRVKGMRNSLLRSAAGPFSRTWSAWTPS